MYRSSTLCFALLALRLLHQDKPRHDHARHKEKEKQQQDESNLHAFILNRALCVAKLVLYHYVVPSLVLD